MAEDIFDGFLRSEFRWPTLGDKFFVEPATQSKSDLDPDPWTRLILMADGYREAADILVARADQEHRSRSVLIYPIIFLYRHFIELELKYLLCTYGPDVGLEPNWTTHNIEALWSNARTIIDRFSAPGEKEGTDAVAKCIAEMSKIDPQSFTFRYPVTRQGELIVFEMDSVDFVHLRRTMEGIGNFFDGVDGQLDNALRP